MNDSFGADFTATQTATAASDQKTDGIVPVLIKQILDSPEGNFQLWDMTFGMVSCAAIVRSIETSSTKITYLLEDHTGRIYAHCWLEESETLKMPDIMVNSYTKIYGSVRNQGGQKTLMVFKMLPITDPNEVCTHVLEALHARYKAEEFATKGENALKGKGDGLDFTVQSGATSGGIAGLEGKQLAVYQAIKNNASEDGISRTTLRKLFQHIKERELDDMLEFMSAEGHVYSSIDADHFVSTE